MTYPGEFNIPNNYGDNKIVLMARDPLTVYAYWEINEEEEDSLKGRIRESGLQISKSVLRVYDVTHNNPDKDPKIAFNFELKDWADSWYIHIDHPEKKWMAEVGLLCTTGEFYCLTRSNVVTTPATTTVTSKSSSSTALFSDSK